MAIAISYIATKSYCCYGAWMSVVRIEVATDIVIIYTPLSNHSKQSMDKKRMFSCILDTTLIDLIRTI